MALWLRKVFKQHREQNSLREEFLNMFKILHEVSTPHEIGTVIIRPLTAPHEGTTIVQYLKICLHRGSSQAHSVPL